ncbi:MAG: hypothetical protein ACM3SM_09485 [Bacteroidota bacterium]
METPEATEAKKILTDKEMDMENVAEKKIEELTYDYSHDISSAKNNLELKKLKKAGLLNIISWIIYAIIFLFLIIKITA